MSLEIHILDVSVTYFRWFALACYYPVHDDPNKDCTWILYRLIPPFKIITGINHLFIWLLQRLSTPRGKRGSGGSKFTRPHCSPGGGMRGS